ncbi:sensor histidine kinase [Streptomyces melanogenes]|uniref:sensor histidine kinase n=1 Tax=Streptomyces melanogenes TaxID=67326 RepID=UPI00167ECD89|nr:histidine kinase [Streptomyces melanogenes]
MALAAATTAYSLLAPLALALTPAPPAGPGAPVPHTSPLAVAVSVAASVSLLLRRRLPLIPAVLATAALLLHGAGGLYPIALYTLVVQGRYRWAGFTGLAGAAIPIVGTAVVPPPPPGLPAPPLPVLIDTYVLDYLVPAVAAPVLIAASVRTYRMYLDVARDRARRLEREQELSALNARLEERTRIARDLHDVVAHYVGLSVIQAGALEIRATDAPVADTARLIGDLGRRAMSELRDLLDVLRTDSDPTAREPVPDAEVTAVWQREVADLVLRTQQAGAAVSWEMSGELTQAGAAANDIAYRVVQEGLSNSLRHAPGAPVHFTVAASSRDLHVRVRNEAATDASPPGGRPPSGGYGLVGMRERVTAMGGSLVSTPTSDAGFLLEATIPTGPTRGNSP